MGATQEALLFLFQHSKELGNIVITIDYNNSQVLGKCSDIVNVNPVLKMISDSIYPTPDCQDFDYINNTNTLSTEILNCEILSEQKFTKFPKIFIMHTLKGKGIFTSLWKIEKFYNKVSILHPEEVLYNDFATLSAFKAWVETDPNLNEKKQKNEEEFLQVYALTDEARFAKYKCTEVQNSAATAYYSLKEILESEDMLESRA